MKKITFYNILLITALAISCSKKDLPDPVDGTPVFSADLNFGNGNTKSWQAGVDSFYMFTSFEKDQSEVLSFIGKMEREKCGTDCKETLTILIRDVSPVTVSLPSIGAALSNDRYSFTNVNLINILQVFDTTITYQLDLAADTSIVPTFDSVYYEWYEDGDIIGDSPNISFTYDQISNTNEIMLKISDFTNGDSCVSWEKQRIFISPAERCAVRIQPHYNVDFFLESLEAVPYPPNFNSSFNWSTGSPESSIFGPFQPFDPYTVTLSNPNDCTSEAGFIWSGFTIGSITSPRECSAHFNYDIIELLQIDTTTLIAPGDSLQLSTVIIIYVDENGHTFRSDHQTQNPNAAFYIENVEDYDDNEKGQATKKISLKFNCMLWDENQNELPIIDGKAVWGVAYPK